MQRLLLALLLTGCASTGVSDREIARLPVADREQIVTASKSIDVAKSNVETAKVAHQQAEQFHKIAQSELEAARTRLQAARGSVELGRDARDDRMLREADRDEEAARDRLLAARAKVDYADRLIELREAKVESAEAELAAAKADVELTKLKLVERAELPTKVDARKLQAERDDAQSRLAETRARVASLEGDVAQLKTAWDDRRRETRGAARDVPPPSAPVEVPMPSMKFRESPKGDVNDTPAAPATPLSQQPTNRIAPNP